MSDYEFISFSGALYVKASFWSEKPNYLASLHHQTINIICQHMKEEANAYNPERFFEKEQ
ncbi:MAG: hypothetical protein ACJAS3_000417 [Roseivirga sp.]